MIRVITIDDSDQSNKALIDLVIEFAKKSKGILIGEKALLAIKEVEDENLIKKMKGNRKMDLLSASEKKAFLNELKIAAKK